jgi:hypothetical protein
LKIQQMVVDFGEDGEPIVSLVDLAGGAPGGPGLWEVKGALALPLRPGL